MERRKGQVSIYRLKKIQEDKERSHELYKQGLTLREIAAKVGRTYGWVWRTKQDMKWDEIALQNKGN
jgi:hypothetical protein